ncbi:MAG TPA: glycosyltransferase family 2 protein, partial [Tepidisphaeraceae bacterium]|nr:glycosyltransferase family 2 protein [Tepidisphaeraceae bacterium]
EYEIWMRRHERLEAQLAKFRRPGASTQGPIFSILLLLNENHPTCLRHSLESVFAQTYPKWELLLITRSMGVPPMSNPSENAHDIHSAPEPALQPLLNDPRVKQISQSSTQTITATLNTALQQTQGEYLILLTDGDELAPHALDVIAEELAQKPTDFLYSDEDKLDQAQKRSSPFFKPDWSPEYFLGTMYTGQLGVYRTSLVRQIGGFRPDYEGAFDYDLALRLTLQTNAITHVPQVLYHRRKSVQRDSAAERRAVEDHLRSRQRQATVLPGWGERFHEVRYAINDRPLISIIMASACRLVQIPRSSAEPGSTQQGYWSLNCFEAIRRLATYDHLELILLTPPQIDAALADKLDSLGVIRKPYQEPFNFSMATNQGAALAEGEQLLLLNDDTEPITPQFIERMLSFSQQPEIGAVGAKLLFSDETIQHAGVVMPECMPGHPFYGSLRYSSGYHGSAQTHCNYLAVTAACMMTRRAVFQQIGGFDESFYMNFNDVDYCLRAIQKGYRIVYQPAAELYHHESMSKPPIHPDELRQFRRRWSSVYDHDPFYNVNFQPGFRKYLLPT